MEGEAEGRGTRWEVMCANYKCCAKKVVEIVFFRVVGQCQAAIAEAVEAFGRIDVLLGSTSEGNAFRFVHGTCLQTTSLNSCYWRRGRAFAKPSNDISCTRHF